LTFTSTMVSSRLAEVRYAQLINLVGGEILDMALARAKPHSRFVMCGAISEYNKKKASGLTVSFSNIKLWPPLTNKRTTSCSSQ